ncbi:MAG TPA: AAA family ATPase, partial [Thermodesulfobacteriaceae bacterium]|nr:AAA family ATPase [Thermodesulfobacteriaceae bacterium]
MTTAPLAERLRPLSLDDFVGQDHLLGKDRILSGMLRRKTLQSLILWGPPGCGKTTLARILARSIRSRFVTFSAVLSGVRELKQVIREARHDTEKSAPRTVLFVDEIHRFNKAQQDAFLP